MAAGYSHVGFIKKVDAMWQYEHAAVNKGYQRIAGVDEAGRGPLAGPVVSAAVILPPDFSGQGINDSKKLSAKKRSQCYTVIMDSALAVATGTASSMEIDEINVLNASMLSMKRAVEGLRLLPDFLMVDGRGLIDSPVHQQAIVKGDSLSISIAAASIVAKVTRDAMMETLHDTYPWYGFNQHKGYPTRAHKEAIVLHGPCFHHRQSFKGVKRI
ncbi:MAG TPA: ribonuclease HII [Desulfobacteraceae bacterium]|nr:ribonuclease HII [Desulfobacteraceae bacterium]